MSQTLMLSIDGTREARVPPTVKVGRGEGGSAPRRAEAKPAPRPIPAPAPPPATRSTSRSSTIPAGEARAATGSTPTSRPRGSPSNTAGAKKAAPKPAPAPSSRRAPAADVDGAARRYEAASRRSRRDDGGAPLPTTDPDVDTLPVVRRHNAAAKARAVDEAAVARKALETEVVKAYRDEARQSDDGNVYADVAKRIDGRRWSPEVDRVIGGISERARATARKAEPTERREAAAQTRAYEADLQTSNRAETGLIARWLLTRGDPSRDAERRAIERQLAATSVVTQRIWAGLTHSLANERRFFNSQDSGAVAAWRREVADRVPAGEPGAQVKAVAKASTSDAARDQVLVRQVGRDVALPAGIDPTVVQRALDSGNPAAVAGAVGAWSRDDGRHRGADADLGRMQAGVATARGLEARIQLVGLARGYRSADVANRDPGIAALRFQQAVVAADVGQTAERQTARFGKIAPTDADGQHALLAYLEWQRAEAGLVARDIEQVHGRHSAEAREARARWSLTDAAVTEVGWRARVADDWARAAEAGVAAGDEAVHQPGQAPWQLDGRWINGVANVDGGTTWNPIAGNLPPRPGGTPATGGGLVVGEAKADPRSGVVTWTVTRPRRSDGPDDGPAAQASQVEVSWDPADGRYRVRYDLGDKRYSAVMSDTDARGWDAWRRAVDTEAAGPTVRVVDRRRLEQDAERAATGPRINAGESGAGPAGGAPVPGGAGPAAGSGPIGSATAGADPGAAAQAVLRAEAAVRAAPTDPAARRALEAAKAGYAAARAATDYRDAQAEVDAIQGELATERARVATVGRPDDPLAGRTDTPAYRAAAKRLVAARARVDAAAAAEAAGAADSAVARALAGAPDGGDAALGALFEQQAEGQARPMVEAYYRNAEAGSKRTMVGSEDEARTFVAATLFPERLPGSLDADQREIVDPIARQIANTAGVGGTVQGLPVVFVDETGKVRRQLMFAVSNGRDQWIIDFDGSRYDDEADYRRNNRTMVVEGDARSVMPAGLNPGFDGNGRMSLSVADSRIRTGRDVANDAIGIAATTAGVAAIGTAVAATVVTGGLASPLLAASMGLAGVSMGLGVTGVGLQFQDAAAHGRSIGLDDPEAVMNWLQLGASVLPLPGVGRGLALGLKAATLAPGAKALALTAMLGKSGVAARLTSGAAKLGGAIDGVTTAIDTASLLRDWDRMSDHDRTMALVGLGGGVATTGLGLGLKRITSRHHGADVDGSAGRGAGSTGRPADGPDAADASDAALPGGLSHLPRPYQAEAAPVGRQGSARSGGQAHGSFDEGRGGSGGGQRIRDRIGAVGQSVADWYWNRLPEYPGVRRLMAPWAGDGFAGLPGVALAGAFPGGGHADPARGPGRSTDPARGPGPGAGSGARPGAGLVPVGNDKAKSIGQTGLADVPISDVHLHQGSDCGGGYDETVRVTSIADLARLLESFGPGAILIQPVPQRVPDGAGYYAARASGSGRTVMIDFRLADPGSLGEVLADTGVDVEVDRIVGAIEARAAELGIDIDPDKSYQAMIARREPIEYAGFKRDSQLMLNLMRAERYLPGVTRNVYLGLVGSDPAAGPGSARFKEALWLANQFDPDGTVLKIAGGGETTLVKEGVVSRLPKVPDLADPDRAGAPLFEEIGDAGGMIVVHTDARQPIEIPIGDNAMMVLVGDSDGGGSDRLLSSLSTVDALKGLFRRFPNTTFVWAHLGGLGRTVSPGRGQIRMMADLLEDPALDNVRFDLSWDAIVEHIAADPGFTRGLAALIVAHPDRFLLGSDSVAAKRPADALATRDALAKTGFIAAIRQQCDAAGESPADVIEALFDGNTRQLLETRAAAVQRWRVEHAADLEARFGGNPDPDAVKALATWREEQRAGPMATSTSSPASADDAVPTAAADRVPGAQAAPDPGPDVRPDTGPDVLPDAGPDLPPEAGPTDPPDRPDTDGDGGATSPRGPAGPRDGGDGPTLDSAGAGAAHDGVEPEGGDANDGSSRSRGIGGSGNGAGGARAGPAGPTGAAGATGGQGPAPWARWLIPVGAFANLQGAIALGGQMAPLHSVPWIARGLTGGVAGISGDSRLGRRVREMRPAIDALTFAMNAPPHALGAIAGMTRIAAGDTTEWFSLVGNLGPLTGDVLLGGIAFSAMNRAGAGPDAAAGPVRDAAAIARREDAARGAGLIGISAGMISSGLDWAFVRIPEPIGIFNQATDVSMAGALGAATAWLGAGAFYHRQSIDPATGEGKTLTPRLNRVVSVAGVGLPLVYFGVRVLWPVIESTVGAASAASGQVVGSIEGDEEVETETEPDPASASDYDYEAEGAEPTAGGWIGPGSDGIDGAEGLLDPLRRRARLEAPV